METANLTGWCEVPLSLLSASELARLKERLTIVPFAFGGDEVEPIEMFRETKKVFKMPLDWGIGYTKEKGIKCVDKRTVGTWHEPSQHTTLPNPAHPKAPMGQRVFLTALRKQVEKAQTVLAESYTGSGKTAMLLRVAAELNVRTLIIVPTETLAQQWEQALRAHLGITHVGRVQQDVCQYDGDYQFVIGIIHSVARRTYPRAFYSAFGLVAWDEVHVVGARSFSQSLGKFSSLYKVALTATPTRKDGCAPLFLTYFGEPSVVNKELPQEAECVIVKYGTDRPLIKGSARHLISRIAKDVRRNQFIAKWIYHLYEDDRNILVLSDNIDQLEALIPLCEAYGVRDCGLFTSEHTSGFVVTYAEVKRPMKGKVYIKYSPKKGPQEQVRVRIVDVLPKGYVYARYLTGNKAGSIEELQVTLLRGEPSIVPKRVKTPAATLDQIKRDARVIFATYGMFKQGQDVPRLDAGIDATPRSSGIQEIGRIRRKLTGKRVPIWVTIHDTHIPAFCKMMDARLREYRKSQNVTIKNYHEK